MFCLICGAAHCDPSSALDIGDIWALVEDAHELLTCVSAFSLPILVLVTL